MYDRAAAFEAFFKRVEGGYIFYRHRFARGISVTEAEHDRMVEAYEDLGDRKALIALVLIVVACFFVVMAVVDAFIPDDSEYLSFVVTSAIAALLLGLLHIRGRSVREPIQGRKADQPRRDSFEFDVAIGRSKAGMKRFYLLMFGLLTVFNMARALMEGSIMFGAAAIFFAAGFLFVLRVSYRTWQADKVKQL